MQPRPGSNAIDSNLLLQFIIKVQFHERTGVNFAVNVELIKRGFEVEVPVNRKWHPDRSINPIAFALHIDEHAVLPLGELRLPFGRFGCEILVREAAFAKIMSEHSRQSRKVAIELHGDTMG